MQFDLNCDPPTTTAQMKRVRVVNGKPRFFHGKKMQKQAKDWAVLLSPHRPQEPMSGALRLKLILVYSHTKASAKAAQKRIFGHVLKVTRPDIDGAVKNLIDTMQHGGFFADDAQIAELECSKWHGPKARIRVTLEPSSRLLQ